MNSVINCNEFRHWYEKIARKDFHNWEWIGWRYMPLNPLEEKADPMIQHHLWKNERTGQTGRILTCKRCQATKKVRRTG